MCGRFAAFSPNKVYAEHFHAISRVALNPRYNVAPSQPILAVREQESGERELIPLRWGLIPSWAKDSQIGYRTINARAETVAEKPAFRHAFKKQRCLIPADGFYEWKPEKGGKQPYFIHRKDHAPLGFAGLWEHWEGEEGVIESCTIIVTTANEALKEIHDRMPVILSPTHYDTWLNPDNQDSKQLQALLKPFPVDRLEAYPVSTAVNSPRNDSAALLHRQA
jgi:putative SOS response-associated peptidase YedK